MITAYKSSIYQIKIININSNNAKSFGSGFYIDQGQYVATNFHVINAVLYEPEEYKAVIELEDKQRIELTLEAVNMVDDLAILSVATPGVPLNLSQQTPQSGERLFSVGNPHDLGMSIVEGNYNGLIDKQFFERIHFSGALNPGMSGGPTLNTQGQVIGVNVATMGNQVGFLIPVEKLSQLLASIKREKINDSDTAIDLKAQVGQQLLSASGFMIEQLLAENWPMEQMADAMVVGQIHPNMHCWGDSHLDKEMHLKFISRGCHSNLNMPLYKSLTSGFIEYEYRYISGESWSEYAFYRQLNRHLNNYQPGNKAEKDDVENYQCIDDVISRNNLKRKVSYCTRQYKEISGAIDAFYLGVTIDKTNQAVIEHYTLSGVSAADAQAFLAQFINKVTWL
jgi:hypothetical protein